MPFDARKLSPGERDADVFPVFRGFAELGMPSDQIAQMLNVDPDLIDDWRSGVERIPAEHLVFLTLILAELVNQREAAVSYGVEKPSSRACRALLRGQNCLQQQEIFNTALAAEAERLGGRQFKDWWQARFESFGQAMDEWRGLRPI